MELLFVQNQSKGIPSRGKITSVIFIEKNQKIHQKTAKTLDFSMNLWYTKTMENTINQTIQYWQNKCRELEKRIEVYKQQILLLQDRQFGRKSERYEMDGQLLLFHEAEECAAPELPESEIEEITYRRKKRKGKREEDLSGLPVEQIIYQLSEEERDCPECEETMHVMGRQVRREVKIIPAQFTVIEHVQMVYSCRSCEKNSDYVSIVKAPIPEPVIKNSIASPSAVAHVMTQKFVNAMPLYRQEKDFLRNGFVLSRQTMANWMITCAENWLQPLYEKLKKLLLKRNIAHADETTIQVLKEPGKKPDTNSYMWMYRTCGDTNKHIVLFEYQPNRRHEHPKEFLKGFRGFLHTDGYAAYHDLPENIVVVGCWAHARRKWEEACKVVPKEKKKSSHAYKGLTYCQKLFLLEREWKDLTPEERKEKRLTESLPIVEKLYQWVPSVVALPKSPLGKAITYMMSQCSYLKNVFLDGRLELSNNRAENSMRPLTLGRKNWLFSCTVNGAKASAVIYSIVQTAMDNGCNPFKYLTYLFEQLPNVTEPIDAFLPWNETVWERCQMPVKG
jgi:transposase